MRMDSQLGKAKPFARQAEGAGFEEGFAGLEETDFSTPLRSGRNDISSVIPGEIEESQVRDAVERCNGNISAAAKMLGISRPTLYAKLKKYGL